MPVARNSTGAAVARQGGEDREFNAAAGTINAITTAAAAVIAIAASAGYFRGQHGAYPSLLLTAMLFIV